MALKTASLEVAMRLMELALDDGARPVKITEHKERIEAWISRLERSWDDLGGVYQYEVDFVARMKVRLDGMYIEWAEGVERTRWCDLPTKPDLCVDDIIREAVYDTEAVYGAHGVDVLAAYLESLGYEGMFKRLCERYLLEIRPLLEEVLPIESDVVEVLSNPRAFFSVTDDDEVRRLAVERFRDKINAQSPEHVKRAIVAHVEFGLGNYVAALSHAEYAHHEKYVSNFGEELARPESEIIQVEMLGVERRKAAILIELLGK